jgi:hypothetical protein
MTIDQVWSAIRRVAESEDDRDSCKLSKTACKLLLEERNVIRQLLQQGVYSETK